jgi:AraC family transcriptional regulator of arabinose operon
MRLQAEGCCEATVNGISHILNPGDLLLCKPGDTLVYNIRSTHPVSGKKQTHSGDYYLNCYRDWIADWWDENIPSAIHIGLDEQIVNIWKSLIYERKKTISSYKEIQEQLIRLLYMAAKRLIKQRLAGGEPLYLPYRIKNYIDLNSVRNLNLQKIAKFAGLGITRTSQIFKQTFGQTITEYIINQRLDMAREQIVYDAVSLEEICYSCGFQTYSHFSRAFRNKFGMSPREFKRENKLQQI